MAQPALVGAQELNLLRPIGLRRTSASYAASFGGQRLLDPEIFPKFGDAIAMKS